MDRVIVKSVQSYEFSTDTTVSYLDGVDASFTVDQHNGATFLNFGHLGFTESDVNYNWLGHWYGLEITGGSATAHQGDYIAMAWEVVV